MTDPTTGAEGNPTQHRPTQHRPAALNEVGQAVERTRLSWRRTVLSGLTVVLLAWTKVLVSSTTPAAVLVVSLMVLTWICILSITRRRLTALRHRTRAPITRSPALVALLVAGCAVLAATLII